MIDAILLLTVPITLFHRYLLVLHCVHPSVPAGTAIVGQSDVRIGESA